MQQARTVLPSLRNKENKYDVLYINTPFSILDYSSIGKLPVNDLVKENAAVFMWVDSNSLSDAMLLVNKWGLKFHSVFQIADYASYNWMKYQKNTSEENVTPPEEVVQKKRTSNRVKRVPPVYLPPWWTNKKPEKSLSSRPTTEQLWLLVKGDASNLFTSSSLPTQVVNIPELGRKSKSKKIIDKGDTERPFMFMDTVLEHLDNNVRVLNLFGSSLKDKVDSWGPNVPGGFQCSTSSGEGISGKIYYFMKTLKKIQLQVIVNSMTKWTESIDTNNEIINDMGETWINLEKCIVEACQSETTPYNWRNDDGLPESWMTRLLFLLAQDNISNFSVNHHRRKKRNKKSNTNSRKQLYGIACPVNIPSHLADFLEIPHDEKIARTKVVSIINKHISSHKLQDENDHTRFYIDDKLKTIITPPDGGDFVKYFELSKLLGKHFQTNKNKVDDKLEDEPSSKKIKISD